MAKKPTQTTIDPAPAPDPEKLLHVQVHDAVIPATMLQYMSQADSLFFGYYMCSFSKMAYNAAIKGKGVAKIGYLKEEVPEKGLLIAIVKSSSVLVEHKEPPAA